MTRRKRIVLWSLVAGLALLACGGFVARGLYRSARLRPFEGRIRDYLATPPVAPGSAYTRGRVVLVDVEQRKVDELHLDLPDDLRADSPDEVGMIVQLRWGQELRGQYGNGDGRAYRHTCQVVVIDKSIPATVGTRSFTGGDPPGSQRRGRGDAYGSRPTQEILRYVEGLPRR